MKLLIAVFFSFLSGILVIVLDFVVLFEISKSDPDPTTSGAYAAVAIMLAPLVFLLSAAGSFLVFRNLK